MPHLALDATPQSTGVARSAGTYPPTGWASVEPVPELDGFLQQALSIARDIIETRVDPQEAAHRMHSEIVSALFHPLSLIAWCHLDNGYEQDTETLAVRRVTDSNLTKAIRAEAGRLLSIPYNSLRRRLERDLGCDDRALRNVKALIGGVLIVLAVLIGAVVVIGLLVALGSFVVVGIVEAGLSRVLSVMAQKGLGMLSTGFTILSVFFSVVLGTFYILGKRLKAHASTNRLRTSPPPVEPEDTHSALRERRLRVLYLRGFEEDSRRIVNIRRDPFEERLCDCLEEWGETLSIGKPREMLVPLGVNRVYLDVEENWKAVVARYMSGAHLIVFRVVGNISDGAKWELRHAVDHVHPEKLLLALPSKRTHYRRFREQTQHIFPVPLPDLDDESLLPSLAGTLQEIRYADVPFIAFDRNWEPIMLPCDRSGLDPLERRIDTSLRPYLDEWAYTQQAVF